MGVTGLWRLIEPAGKPVPIETLENKVLAVDISIWLHQVVKGYQNAKGAPMPNAHLLGLFQRLCKLLYYRIKPVFVFDGGYPDLKKETIAKRQDSKAKFNSESERLKREIMLLLGKRTAIHSILGDGSSTSPKKSPKKGNTSYGSGDDMFKLPEIKNDDTKEEESETESESEDDDSQPIIDLHSVDLESETFKSLPLREKHNLLTDLKETRKMNSWGRIHELPKQSDDFSNFQMCRLLKRRQVQECLEETEKEMGGNFFSINELESILNEEGIETKLDSLPTKRIAYDDKTRYLLIKDLKKAKEDAIELERKKAIELERKKAIEQTEKDVKENNIEKKSLTEDENEDLQRAIQMSLECDVEKKCESSPDSTFMLDTDYSDSEEEETPFIEFNSAKAYIIQNTDFTVGAIDEIIHSKSVINKKETKFKKDLFKFHADAAKNEKAAVLSSESDSEEVSESCVPVKDQNSCIILDDSIKEANNTIDLSSSIEKETQSVDSKHSDCEVNEITGSSESDSSEEDFIEVDESLERKNVVAELNINYEEQIKDDIFADVFSNNAKIEKFDKTNETVNLIEVISEENLNELPVVVKSDNNENITSNKSDITILCENKIHVQEDKESNLCETTKTIEIIDAIKTQNKIIDATIESHNQDSDNVVTEKVILEKDTHKNNDEIALSENKSSEAQIKNTLTNEQLTEMAANLRKEEELLEQEKGKLDRMSRNISEEMTRDAKELLQLFGIPYVVAPTEAEAQCAFLECANLTDGTITDDSDIWLFGGRTVYKNFFDQRKHVLQFQAEKIERSFNLSREQLILLALLVGSDYTLGVRGVGPVTAMEILASFSLTRKDKLTVENASNLQMKCNALLVGLQEFKRWVKSGKRTDDTSLRNKLKNVNVTDEFPSLRVVQAYLEPKVNQSKESFTWGHPDVTTLRDFARNKFGWSQTKFDEIMTPVLKRMQQTTAQKSLNDYFKKRIEYQDVQLSKRVRAAVEKMGPEELVEKKNETKPKKVRKRKVPEQKVESEHFLNLEQDAPVPTTSKQILNKEPEKQDGGFDIKVPKLDRYQEIIPQRERERLNVVQTKLRAIELYRKTKIDKPLKTKKKETIKPKEDAGLSESDSN